MISTLIVIIGIGVVLVLFLGGKNLSVPAGAYGFRVIGRITWDASGNRFMVPRIDRIVKGPGKIHQKLFSGVCFLDTRPRHVKMQPVRMVDKNAEHVRARAEGIITFLEDEEHLKAAISHLYGADDNLFLNEIELSLRSLVGEMTLMELLEPDATTKLEQMLNQTLERRGCAIRDMHITTVEP